MSKIIYNYRPDTAEFVSASNADPSPLESGVFLIPAFATDIQPPQTSDGQIAVFSNGKWSVKTIPTPSAAQLLAQAQQAQLASIGSACAASIMGGFKSSALGKPYTYPSNETDQLNLSGSVMSSLFPNLPANWTTLQVCCDANGNWTYLPHTVTQIQQVGIDFKAFKLNCLTRNATLQAQVAAATTVAAVQAINF